MIKHGKHRVYYSMGEVAEMFDLTPSLIRYWESQFDILKPDKNKKGNRMFTPKDVDNLKIIYHLVKEKGMTLKGAQRRIESSMDEIQRNVEIVDKLLNIKSVLLEIREELNRVDVGTGGVELVVKSAGEGEVLGSKQQHEIEDKPFDIVEQQEEWSVVDGLEQGQEHGGDELESSEELEIEGKPVLDEKITHLVQLLIDTEEVDPEYVSHLSEELSEEAQTAIEVMETLIDMDEESKQPEERQQTLF